MAKRALDIALALALLPFAMPVLAIAALAVRLDSPGPAFFRQERVGRHRKPFRLLKIRTMTVGTPQAASHEVGAAQVTRVGAFLRRSKIDELPQIFAVLAGDMSFVGPRPCLAVQEELVAEIVEEAGLLPRPFRAEMPHPIRPRQLQRPARAAR